MASRCCIREKTTHDHLSVPSCLTSCRGSASLWRRPIATPGTRRDSQIGCGPTENCASTGTSEMLTSGFPTCLHLAQGGETSREETITTSLQCPDGALHRVRHLYMNVYRAHAPTKAILTIIIIITFLEGKLIYVWSTE